MNNSQNSGPDSVFANLSVRVRTGLGLGGACAALLLLASFGCWGRWLLLLVAAVMLLAAAFELAQLCTDNDKAVVGLQRLLFALLAFLPAALLLAYAFRQGLCSGALDCGSTAALVGLGTYISFFFGLALIFSRSRGALQDVAVLTQQLLAGLLLVGFCGAFILALILLPVGTGKLLWFVLVVCVNDIAAYFVGSRIRGPPLAPAVSPKKTVSGSIAGLACGGVIGTITFGLVSVEATSFTALLLALLIVAAAQGGDLCKSFIKRLAGAKDSGSIFPGHGGVLDRIDGLLGAAPLLYFWLGFSMGA